MHNTGCSIRPRTRQQWVLTQYDTLEQQMLLPQQQQWNTWLSTPQWCTRLAQLQSNFCSIATMGTSSHKTTAKLLESPTLFDLVPCLRSTKHSACKALTTTMPTTLATTTTIRVVEVEPPGRAKLPHSLNSSLGLPSQQSPSSTRPRLHSDSERKLFLVRGCHQSCLLRVLLHPILER